MSRIATIALIGAAFAFALPALADRPAAEPPRSLDQQEGNQITIRGIVTVLKKGTVKETFYVDGYKLRGLSRDKLLPWVGKRVVVTGEFKVILGDLIIYARSIEEAPERDPDDFAARS